MRAVWTGGGQPEAGATRGRAERELFVVLTIVRNERTLPASFSLTPREGDTAAIAVFTGSQPEALEAMAVAGWAPIPPAAEAPPPAG